MSDSHNVQGKSHKDGAIKTAAKTLIGLGYAVCRIPAGKKRATDTGWTTRSATPDEFQPGDMIGIVTGPASHGFREGHALVGVDLDSPEAVERADEFLPDTGMIEGRPGKPRSHRYYLVPLDTIPEAERSHAPQAAQAAIEKYDHPGPRTMSFRKPGGGEAIRLCGTGAQLVVPPSIHSDSGEPREWTGGPVGGEPGEPEVLPFPALLAAVQGLADAIGCQRKIDRIPDLSSYRPVDLPRDTRIDRARKYLATMDPAISGQNGHNTTFRAACAMTQRFGLTFDETMALMMNEYNPKCEPPWSLYELQHKVQSAINMPCDRQPGYMLTESNGHAGHGGVDISRVMPSTRRETSPPSSTPPARPRRVIPEYKPFPVDALPKPMRTIVGEIAKAVDCDAGYAAVPALTLAGATIGGVLVASPKRGFKEPPTLFALTVGDSGTAKSPAADPFGDISTSIEESLYLRYQSDCQAAQAEQLSPAIGGEPQPAPVREYFRATDITIERLIENLQTSPRGMLLWFDEARQWFESFGRYKGKGGGSDATQWLSMFDAKPIMYQRKMVPNRDIYVRRAAVSVFGTIQPGVLAEVLNNPGYIHSGLAGRILFVMPPKKCPRWNDRELDPDTESAFTGLLNDLRFIPFNPRSPARVGLDFEALKVFAKFSDSMMERAENLDGGPMSAALPKLARIALRLALIHHAVIIAAAGEDPGRHLIKPDSMQAGITIAEWFAHEAERVYAMFSETPEDRDARKLADLIRRKGGRVSPRDLQRADRARWPNKEAAALALDALEAAGYGSWQEIKPEGAGRPGRVFVIYPTPDTIPDDMDDDDE